MDEAMQDVSQFIRSSDAFFEEDVVLDGWYVIWIRTS
tara:strand:+ start:243 stop:353 length:111 start_codon:yes stop_codon:yes gene_type:complete